MLRDVDQLEAEIINSCLSRVSTFVPLLGRKISIQFFFAFVMGVRSSRVITGFLQLDG